MCLWGCIYDCVNDYMNYVSLCGGNMYTELISSFHMCSVTINAFEWHLLHLFAGESTHLAMWRFPRNLKCWRQSLRKHNSKVFSDKKTDKMECMWSHWGEPEQSRCWDKQETRKVNLLHSLVDRSSHWNYSLFFFSLPLSYSVSIFILATFPFLLFLFTCPQPRLSRYRFFSLSLSLSVNSEYL